MSGAPDTRNGGVPTRPRYSSPAVLEIVAAALAPEVAVWAQSKDIEGVARDLVQAMSSGNQDAYAIARELERTRYYDPDRDLVEILDAADFWGARDSLVADWVSANGISAPLEVGSKVRARHGDGVISKVDQKLATYVVSQPDDRPGCGVIVAAEDCAAISSAVDA